MKPPDMSVGTPAFLRFAVGPDEQAVQSEVDDAPMAPFRPVYIGRNMRVTLLEHSNFEILSRNGETKPLGLDESASWQWEVRPKERGGSFELFAKVEVLKSEGGRIVTLEDYTKRVSVNVRVGTWQGLLLALRNAQTLGELLAVLFKTWETTLAALALLIAAGGGVIAAVRKLGPKGRERRTANRQRRATKKAARAARRSRRT